MEIPYENKHKVDIWSTHFFFIYIYTFICVCFSLYLSISLSRSLSLSHFTHPSLSRSPSLPFATQVQWPGSFTTRFLSRPNPSSNDLPPAVESPTATAPSRPECGRGAAPSWRERYDLHLAWHVKAVFANTQWCLDFPSYCTSYGL